MGKYVGINISANAEVLSSFPHCFPYYLRKQFSHSTSHRCFSSQYSRCVENEITRLQKRPCVVLLGKLLPVASKWKNSCSILAGNQIPSLAPGQKPFLNFIFSIIVRECYYKRQLGRFIELRETESWNSFLLIKVDEISEILDNHKYYCRERNSWFSARCSEEVILALAKVKCSLLLLINQQHLFLEYKFPWSWI